MNTLPTAANAYADWRLVARVLGLPCTGDALPARTVCPFCGGSRLNIYKDSTTNGQWHYCFDCEHAGDMIDLAAGAWGISQDAAMRKLSDEGVPIPPELLNEQAEYNFTLIKRRHQAHDLWRRSNRQLAAITDGSPVIRHLRERLGLFSRIASNRWQDGPGKMFGAATPRQLNEALLPPGTCTSQRIDNGHLIFRQPGWRDVLTLPFFSAPKNLEGFLFVGRQGGPTDRIYRRVMPGSHGHYEGGLFGLDTVETGSVAYQRHVFAVDDAVLALKLQVRHSAQSTKPLPLVAWYDHRTIRTAAAWYAVERPVIILGWKLNASLLWSAICCDGQISLFPVRKLTTDVTDNYLRSMTPDVLLRRAMQKAKPWREALIEWAEIHGPAAIEELLLNLRTYPIDHREIATILNFNPDITQPFLRTTTIGSNTYIERPSGWYMQAVLDCRKRIPEHLFSEVIIRLDYVTSGAVPRYYGRVILNGKTAPFECAVGEVAAQVTTTCIQANLGVPRLPRRGYRLEEVAVAFQRPQIVSEEAAKRLCGSKAVPARNASNAKPRVQAKS